VPEIIVEDFVYDEENVEKFGRHGFSSRSGIETPGAPVIQSYRHRS
jgi:hypothetical protein